MRLIVMLVMLLMLAAPALAAPPLLAMRAQMVGDNNLHPKDFDKLTTRNLEAGVVVRLGPLFGNVDFPLARAKQPRDFKLKVGVEIPLIK